MNKPRVILKPRSMCVTPAPDVRLTYDRAGRLHEGLVNGSYYRVGLDTSVIRKSDRRVRVLDPSQQVKFHGFARSIAGGVYRAYLEREAVVERLGVPEADDLEPELERIVKRDARLLEAERREFHRIYSSSPLLPPDQMLSTVVQPSCSLISGWCSRLTPAIRLLRSDAELVEHLVDVKRFLGRSIELRPSVFIDHQDLPDLGYDHVSRTLDLIAGDLKPCGICSYADVFSMRQPSERLVRAMRERGVRRLYLRIESGSKPLLQLFCLSLDAPQLASYVSALKSGGLSVGIMLLAGIGGSQFESAHLEDTAELLEALPLGAADRVYFSPLPAGTEDELAELTGEEGLRTLGDQDTRAQFEIFRKLFARHRGDVGPKVCLFNELEAVY